MGCAQSKIENEEAVTRCKERKQFMKEAVGFRNAFAAAHSAYVVSLKNTGAALSDYGQAEAQDALRASPGAPPGAPTPSSAANPVVVNPPSDETFHPPPPLPPDFPPAPLQRSASMPDLPLPIPRRRRGLTDQPSPADAAIREEDGDELEDDTQGDAGPAEAASPAPPPRPPPQPQPQASPAPPPPPENKPTTWDYFFGMDDNMHGPPLRAAEEIRPEKDGMEEEPVEKYRRGASVASASTSTSAAVDAGVAGVDVSPPPVTPEKVVVEPPVPPPKQGKKQKGSVHHQYAASAGSVDAKKGKMVPSTAPSVTLLQVLTDLDDHFLKASESAQEVSKMLEANRLHYHSNFADNRGVLCFWVCA